MQQRKLITNQWIPKWIFDKKITLVYYESDKFDNKKEIKRVDIKVSFVDLMNIRNELTEDSRQTDFDIEFFTLYDVGGYDGYIETKFNIDGEEKTHIVEDVQRFFDNNGNFRYCNIKAVI